MNDIAYQTPTNSMGTSTEKAFLNALDCFQPSSVTSVYILYAKGTCWWLHAGSKPTYTDKARTGQVHIRTKCQSAYNPNNHKHTLWIIPASPRAVYAPRENPKMQMRSPALSKRACQERKQTQIMESAYSSASRTHTHLSKGRANSGSD